MVEENSDDTMAGAIKVGDTFSSFDDLVNKLEIHKQVTCTDFFIRDNRTLSIAATKMPHRVVGCNEALKYYYLKYSCIYGGQKLRGKPLQSGRASRSLRLQGCCANICLILSKDNKFLVVKSMNANHSHPLLSIRKKKKPSKVVKQQLLTEQQLELLRLYNTPPIENCLTQVPTDTPVSTSQQESIPGTSLTTETPGLGDKTATCGDVGYEVIIEEANKGVELKESSRSLPSVPSPSKRICTEEPPVAANQQQIKQEISQEKPASSARSAIKTRIHPPLLDTPKTSELKSAPTSSDENDTLGQLLAYTLRGLPTAKRLALKRTVMKAIIDAESDI